MILSAHDLIIITLHFLRSYFLINSIQDILIDMPVGAYFRQYIELWSRMKPMNAEMIERYWTRVETTIQLFDISVAE